MSQTTNLGLFKHDNPATNTNAFDVKSALNDNWDKIDENAGDIKNALDEKVDTTQLQAGFNKITTMHNEDMEEINSKVNKLGSGSPLVANSVSEMTDTAKVYVNISDGNWYYYDGTAWKSGGIYQASVKSDDVNSLLNRSISIYDYEHAKILNANNSGDTISNSESNRTLFIPITQGETYLVGRMITDNKYMQIAFTDADKVGANVIGEKTIININGQKRILDNPVEVTAPQGASYMSIWFYNTSDTYSQIQIGKSIYIFKSNYLKSLIQNAKGVFGINSVRVNQNNYNTVIPDFNNAEKSKAYVFYYASNNTNVPLNSPVENIIDGLLLSFSSENFNTTIQLFIQNNIIYYRSCDDNSIWNSWYVIVNGNNNPKTFYIGANRKYKTLKEGIEEAVKYKNAIVYVDAGTYDIIEEYGGQTYVDTNYSGSTMGNGIILKNNVHVIFSTNSKVICNFEGSNSRFMDNFSPFNVGAGGFTLENLNIECNKVRYCIHDDLFSSDETYTKTHYINCNMYLDNNNNTVRENYSCIGGGMPINGSVIIDGCIFESTAHMSSSNMTGGVDYHQNGNSKAQCKILIKNSVCLGNRDNFSFSNLGTSTKISRVIVTNTKSKLAPTLSINSNYPTNVELIAFNNVIA